MVDKRITTAFAVAGTLALVSGLAYGAGQTRTGLSEKRRQAECSKATLQGEYLIMGRADSRSDSPSPTRPLVFAGVRTFTGDGVLSQVETVSIGGQISRLHADSGIYALDSNCIGTMTVATRNFDIFVARDGSEGVAVGTIDGGITTHSFKRR